MKKWNKKIYIFFSLFFVLSLFLYPSFNVLASNESSEDYIPDSTEKYYFSRSILYEEGVQSDGMVKMETKNYFSSPSGCDDEIIVYLDGGTFLASSVSFLRGNSSEGIFVSYFNINSYSDGTVKKTITSKNGPYRWVTCEYENCVNNEFNTKGTSYGGYHTNMKVFSSKESAVAYAENGDLSGIMSNPFETEELTESNSVYDSNIGYLQNVTFNSRNVGSDNSDLDNMTYYFSYDSVTNTGFDINQDGVRVSFYSTYKGIYYDSWAKYFKKDGNVKRFDNKILQVSAQGSDRLEFSYEDCMKSHASEKAETEALCDSSVPTFGQVEYWLRIEQKRSDGTWRYGGWVNCSNQSASVQGDSIADDCITQTYDGNGNLDVDGGYGSGNSTPHTYGEGSTMESADADAIENENHKRAFESIEDFGDGLELMKVQLGNIPKVIAEVFLALPSALIVAITSGFFVCIVLRILGR